MINQCTQLIECIKQETTYIPEQLNDVLAKYKYEYTTGLLIALSGLLDKLMAEDDRYKLPNDNQYMDNWDDVNNIIGA